jgi:hypothetical protein
VIRIEQAIGCLAVPVDSHDEASPERQDDPVEDRHGQPVRTAALDARDQRLRATHQLREVGLPPRTPGPKAPDDPTHAHDIHLPARLPSALRPRFMRG